jgi:hypothetical protein
MQGWPGILFNKPWVPDCTRCFPDEHWNEPLCPPPSRSGLVFTHKIAMNTSRDSIRDASCQTRVGEQLWRVYCENAVTF